MLSFEEIFAPLFWIIDPSKRLFYIYIISALLFGLLTLGYQKKLFSIQLFKELLHPKIWLHTSSLLDFKILVFNSLFKTLLFTGTAISSVPVAIFFARFLNQNLPSSLTFDLSHQMGYLLYGIISFLVLDFSRFFQHYLFHKIPFLWRFHKVHHSAQVLTPLTLYRTHPVESIISNLRRAFVIGLVSGSFIFFTQSAISGLAILGVNAFDFIFNFLGSNLRHSHIWLSFGPLNYLLISPAQHQVHHSRAERHYDKNFGIAISIWDQLFGTFENTTSKKPFLIFGVKNFRPKNLSQALITPFKNK